MLLLIIVIIGIIFIIIVAVGIAFFVGKKWNGIRKKRANELNDDDVVKNKKLDYISNYIDKAKLDNTYAGDIEISISALLLNCNIRMYYQSNSSFTLYNEFNASKKIGCSLYT